jgi:hypothetical protein
MTTRAVLRCLTALVAMAVVSGCGGQQTARTAAADAAAADVRTDGGVSPATTGTTPAPSLAAGQLLILFKRAVGVDPLSSQLTVDRDGRTAALITLGGPGGQHKQLFAMPAAQLRHLRRLLQNTRLRDTTCCDARYYIYDVSAQGHSWRLQQGDIPGPLRPLIAYLNAILDRHTAYNGPS